VDIFSGFSGDLLFNHAWEYAGADLFIHESNNYKPAYSSWFEIVPFLKPEAELKGADKLLHYIDEPTESLYRDPVISTACDLDAETILENMQRATEIAKAIESAWDKKTQAVTISTRTLHGATLDSSLSMIRAAPNSGFGHLI
jgi:hypothetical protein